MNQDEIPPNELAEYYDSIFSVLDQVPSDSHPAWEFALEAVLFGGEGLADSATPYGEQQAERNSFKITDYREQYGNGEKVTEFSAINTGPPRENDRQYLDGLCIPPKSPESGRVLPIFVGETELAEAISILAEFPTAPEAEERGNGGNELLNPSRFPGLSTQAISANDLSGDDDKGRNTQTEHSDLKPNELADLYEIFRLIVDEIPGDSDPRWMEAVESLVYGGEFLHDEGVPYGEQQAQRNDFKMAEYREVYGNGEQVTEFPTLDTVTIQGDSDDGDNSVQVPVAPESEVPIPLRVESSTLGDEISLLSEFPVEPSAKDNGASVIHILDMSSVAGLGHQSTPDEDRGDSGVSSTSKSPLAGSRKEDSGEEEPPSIGFTHSAPLDSNDSADPSIGTASDSDATPGSDASDGRTPKNEPDPPVSGGETSSQEKSTSHGSESEVTASGSSTESSAGDERVQTPSDTEPSTGADDHSDMEASGDSKVLRDEGVGESQIPDVENKSQTEPTSVLDEINDADRKHDDPHAEYAHRKAQQRDPRDVVELGETISLVIKEADFQSRPPTVMGTKNKLVIFVTEAPRHVSKFDTIRAKVVDFGGENNSAEAVFLGFEN